MEYTVELLKSTVKKLSVEVDIDEKASFQVETQNGSAIYEPNDDNDPTVMVQTECKMRDVSNNQLAIDMTVEMVFKIDPIPENRTDVVKQHCLPIIRQELCRLTGAFLQDMGQKIVIS